MKGFMAMKYAKSEQLYQQALNLIPGGVNSPVRACKSVGADPLFIDRADGCLIYDADGRRGSANVNHRQDSDFKLAGAIGRSSNHRPGGFIFGRTA